MPDTRLREYNPLINGFSDAQGPMDISLNEAKDRFGQFPSIYGIVSEKKSEQNQKRQENKVLNLKIGYFIKDLLERKKINLKGEVHQFFNTWHRDLENEFGICTAPFFNIHDTRLLKGLIRKNKAIIDQFSNADIRQHLSDSGLIRKDILNSIHPDVFLKKTALILQRKIKSSVGKGTQQIQKVLNDINCHATMMAIKQLTGEQLLSLSEEMIQGFTDEICSYLLELNTFNPLKQIKGLKARKGSGIEFEYATRDESFLKLGKITSDCTADKRGFQSDINIENIFWTVFSWILDRNYQILKVYFNNEFVMKVHLLPLFVSASGCLEFQSITPGRSDYIILAVDAIETTVAFRGQLEGTENNYLDRYRDEIFSKTMDCITGLADNMNINDIYAEKFSNTPWVREKLNVYPEIFLHVDHMIKIDQLEDVYYLAKKLSARHGYDMSEEVFMEIQMKNTFLQPGYINKAPRVKSFGLIRGNARDGIPMKQIIGV
ncbi:hypothetical protein [Desulfobacula sp.]|uniref:hypothetical protein n=1 Tax=Desulfobacula sp. TaxID=2593537 RepID=UPI0026044E2E|nr:hypothetical protein [Desulfobacula sp.]